MLAQAGLNQVHLRRKMMDLAAARAGRENVATPRELARLLELLFKGKLLEPALTADLLKVFSTPKEGDLTRFLPEGVRVASKPGALEGVRCDSGIIFVENRPFIVVAMTAFLKDDKAGEQAIGQVAQAAYRTFEALGSSSPHGRTLGSRKAR
jgi:beta-lactamase class A